jgi:hypothetical protein
MKKVNATITLQVQFDYDDEKLEMNEALDFIKEEIEQAIQETSENGMNTIKQDTLQLASGSFNEGGLIGNVQDLGMNDRRNCCLDH